MDNSINNSFDIPVSYKGKELTFPAKLIVYRYVYKIAVEVNRIEVVCERDDQGDFRAIGDLEKVKTMKIDIELLKAIGKGIEETFKVP